MNLWHLDLALTPSKKAGIKKFRTDFKTSFLNARSNNLVENAARSLMLAGLSVICADIPQLVILGKFSKGGTVDKVTLGLAIVGCILSILMCLILAGMRLYRTYRECLNNATGGDDTLCSEECGQCCGIETDPATLANLKWSNGAVAKIQRIITAQPK